MHSLLCLIAVVTGVQAEPLLDKELLEHVQKLWEKFQFTYNKTYSSKTEEEVRSKIFEANVKYISAHNKKYLKGDSSYYLGINEFSDLTHREFLIFYTSSVKMVNKTRGSTYLPPNNVVLPSIVDWRTEGYVTPVKNQGRCGSCWAFSATGSLEGQHFRKKGKLVSLSEQQLVDCSKENYGCNGGHMDLAFKYIKETGGVEGESDYPYVGTEQVCKFRASLVKATDTGCITVGNDETNLKSVVGTVGPVSVAIDASHESFQSYAGGIYDEPLCSQYHLNHGVLVVGYGTSPSDYWLVKNSWGTSWGQSGYILMSRNKDNQCGIASDALYPIVYT